MLMVFTIVNTASLSQLWLAFIGFLFVRLGVCFHILSKLLMSYGCHEYVNHSTCCHYISHIIFSAWHPGAWVLLTGKQTGQPTIVFVLHAVPSRQCLTFVLRNLSKSNWALDTIKVRSWMLIQRPSATINWQNRIMIYILLWSMLSSKLILDECCEVVSSRLP